MLDEDVLIEKMHIERVTEFPDACTAKAGRDGSLVATALKEPPLDLTETRKENSVFKVFYINEEWLL